MSLSLVVANTLPKSLDVARRQPAAIPVGLRVSDANPAVSLFGLDLRDATLKAAALSIVVMARSRSACSIAFVNAHCINTMYRDHDYRRALREMDVLYADGIGMRLAARAGGYNLRDNVNGTDLLPVLCGEAAAAKVGMYFLGGREGVAAAAADRMTATTGVRIAGAVSGYLGDPSAERRAIEAINASGAEVLLVGMGVPLQEAWIARNRTRLRPSVIIGVGGLFDYYSGRILRAPVSLRRLGLEWAWRLAMEPRRLARRYLLGNVEFMARVAFLRVLAPVEIRQPAR